MELLMISWPTLILLGLGLRMAVRLHYGTRGPEAADPVHDLLAISSWVLIALGLVPAICGAIFTLFGLIILALAAATLVEVVTERRAAQRRSICKLLALFVDRRMHLDPLLLLSAQTIRGRVGKAAKKLFIALDAGASLSDAVRANRRALPREAIAYVAGGATIQSETAALKELSRTDHSELTNLWRACIDRIAYLACVLLTMSLVLTFLMIKIVPAYVDIFQEFGLELPALTRLAASTSTTFVRYAAIPTIFVAAITIVAIAIVGLLYLCDVPVLRDWGDRLFRCRRSADVLRILAVAAEQRQPLTTVLTRVAQVYPSSTIRHQLRRAAQSAVGGGVWQQSLSAVGVINSAEAGLLLSAERTGNLPWALRQVAIRREKCAVYRLATALQLVYPGVIVLLGIVVGFYVVSLFLPLVRLIESLAV